MALSVLANLNRLSVALVKRGEILASANIPRSATHLNDGHTCDMYRLLPALLGVRRLYADVRVRATRSTSYRPPSVRMTGGWVSSALL